jgi:hypothetical protein
MSRARVICPPCVRHGPWWSVRRALEVPLVTVFPPCTALEASCWVSLARGEGMESTSARPNHVLNSTPYLTLQDICKYHTFLFLLPLTYLMAYVIISLSIG